MRRCLTVLLILAAGTARAADAPKSNALTPKEIADGWVQLFDGQTLFGWKTEVGAAKVETGELVVLGAGHTAITSTSVFGDVQVHVEFNLKDGKQFQLVIGDQPAVFGPEKLKEWVPLEFNLVSFDKGTSIEFRTPASPNPIVAKMNHIRQPTIGFAVSNGDEVRLRNLRMKPLGLAPIFNGKDLTGWKRFTAEEKRAKSKFTVTPEGWINIKNGPGDLQTEKQWADFVFQGECISNGKALNSGVFFRCLPDKYQQGYEYQIHNGFKDNDRTKPADYGTGAIYNRVKARKVVPNDHEWFTMTLIAHGNHISTWVNGYQTVDWTDTRKENDNARNGCKLGAGPISLQGHDPTTDLSFRNLRIAELKKKE